MAKERTPEQQAIVDKMDAAAVEAAAELATFNNEDPLALLTAWWTTWYPKAGHKRLGKLLVKRG